MEIIPSTIVATTTVLSSFFGNIREIASNNLYHIFKSFILSEPENPIATPQSKYPPSGPGYHSGAGPVKGSRAHELEILDRANQQNGQLISTLQKQLYAYDGPRSYILDPKQSELADCYSCELFSAYIDKYRPYGIDENNAVLWQEPGTSRGSQLGSATTLLPDVNKWSARAEVLNGSAWKSINMPDCQVAIHELMHVEEFPPNSSKNSEVLTVTRDLINLDSIRKRILGSPIEQEESYGKSLKIASSPQGFAKTCSIPLGKFINFYRDLEKRKSNLAEAIASPESIDFLTGCQAGFHEYESLVKSLVKSIQGGHEFEAALNYVKEHIGSKDLEFQKSAFFLLKELVKQGQSEPFAMKTVIDSIERSPHSRIQDEVLDLLKELLINGKQTSQISEYIINNIKNYRFIDNCLAVMKELVKYGNFDEAFAIKTGIEYSYRDLLDELFKKNKGFANAIEYVNANIRCKYEWMNAVELLIQLVKYRKHEEVFAIPVAISFLEAGCSTSLQAYSSRRAALRLFEALFKNGKGIDSAIEFVTKNIDSKDRTIQQLAYDLLVLLVEHGQCAEIAIHTVTANRETKDVNFKIDLLTLKKKLDMHCGIYIS